MSTNDNNYRGFEAVIGIEVHVQLKTKSKIFSSDSTEFDSSDNGHISPVTLGMPGTLPVLNKSAIYYAIKTGLALNCQIRKKNVFSRKNYFYPDLPKGYQISQYDEPICEKGFVEFKLNDQIKKIGITRAHLEEDAGKSTHFGQYTLLNYNRAGIPLLEIVSEPDLRTPQEAAEYCRTIKNIVQYLEVCDGNLEEGSLRCDCNVSVRKFGESKFGTKVELKNINSFRFVEKAIEYEIHRQIDQIENNQKIIQETRLYDADKNRTYTMRTKEDAEDYRYFPDPDILPVVITDQEINQIQIPELYTAKALRFVNEYGLQWAEAHLLCESIYLARYFEDCGKRCGQFKLAASWITTELLRELNENHLTILNSKISSSDLADLLTQIHNQTISGKIGKMIFKEMWSTGKNPLQIIKEKNLSQNSNTDELQNIIEKIVCANPELVKDFKLGKTKVIGFFVGAIMKETKGQANPGLVNEILIKELNK